MIRSLFPILFLLSGMVILWSQVIPDGKTILIYFIELDGPDTIGKSFILQNCRSKREFLTNPMRLISLLQT